mgnify:CR=1 FL=1
MKRLDEESEDVFFGRNKFAFDFLGNEALSGKVVLDIGCGFGWLERKASAVKCAKIIGIDIDEENIQRLIAENTFAEVSFLKASAIDLPFKEESFDTVVSLEVMEHIPKGKERKYFHEAYRVLKKGGTFCLSTPNDHVVAKLLDPAWVLIHHRHYKVEDVLRFAESAGFSVEKCELRGGLGELIGGLNMYFSKWVLRRRMLFEGLFRLWQNREFQRIGFSGIFLKLRKPYG